MIILVDIGNTNAKWRVCARDGGVVLAEGSRRTSDIAKLVGDIDVVATGPARRSVDIVVSSVAGEVVNSRLTEALVSSGWVSPHLVSVRRECLGVTVAYEHLSQLGVDRWLGLIASHKYYKDCNKVVVSAGSALTADFVTFSGEHMGGLIAPGLGMMRASLNAGTQGAKSSDDAMTLPWRLGVSTQQCVSSGVASMCVGWCAQLLQAARREFSGGRYLCVLISGGDAADVNHAMQCVLSQSEFGDAFEVDVKVVPLVLEGLSLIAGEARR